MRIGHAALEQMFSSHFVTFVKIIQGLTIDNSQEISTLDAGILNKLLLSLNSLIGSLKNGDFEQQKKFLELFRLIFVFFSMPRD